MCQFCGVDPAFAAYFEDPSGNNNNNKQEVQEDAGFLNAPTGDSTPAPNFFRLKPTNKRYQSSGRITTQQLTTFGSSLSPNARVYMGHHGQPYNDAIRRWSNCAVKRALAVVMVASAEDVSKTVRSYCLFFMHGKQWISDLFFVINKDHNVPEPRSRVCG